MDAQTPKVLVVSSDHHPLAIGGHERSADGIAAIVIGRNRHGRAWGKTKRIGRIVSDRLNRIGGPRHGQRFSGSHLATLTVADGLDTFAPGREPAEGCLATASPVAG